MSEDKFSAEEIARCVAAMEKPSPRDALRAIASGSVVVRLTPDRYDVIVTAVDGKPARDPDYPNDPKRTMGLAGAWPLYRAGMIDADGCVTDAGRAFLARIGR